MELEERMRQRFHSTETVHKLSNCSLRRHLTNPTTFFPHDSSLYQMKLLVPIYFGVVFGVIFFVASAQQRLSVITKSKPGNCDDDGTQKSKDGDSLTMHYTGTIDKSSPSGEKGKQFDSSIGRGPFTFTLGKGEVISGWDQGLKNMCVGEKRTLVIPANLGYGDTGAGNNIPPGANLNFEVELLGINQ